MAGTKHREKENALHLTDKTSQKTNKQTNKQINKDAEKDQRNERALAPPSWETGCFLYCCCCCLFCCCLLLLLFVVILLLFVVILLLLFFAQKIYFLAVFPHFFFSPISMSAGSGSISNTTHSGSFLSCAMVSPLSNLIWTISPSPVTTPL